jgi:hypothetical protein
MNRSIGIYLIFIVIVIVAITRKTIVDNKPYHQLKDSSVIIVAGYGLDGWGFHSRERQWYFFFSTESIPALGPT